VDTTNLTNYDNPQGIISSDYSKVQLSPPTSESFSQPTPIDAESPFLTLLYQSRSDITTAPSESENPSSSQKEKEKLHHVDSILALNHDKNVIDQLVLDPIPSTTNTDTKANSNPTTTITEKYDDMLSRIEL